MVRERSQRAARSKTRAVIVARVGNGELSKYLHATLCHRGEEGHRSDRPEVSVEFATKHRAAVARVVYLAQDRLDLGVAAVVARYLHGHPDYLEWYPFQENTDTIVLTKNHVDRIQEGLCNWRITSSPRGVVFNHASH